MQASGGGALALEPSESALAIGVKVLYLGSDTQLLLLEHFSFWDEDKEWLSSHMNVDLHVAASLIA